MQTLSKKGNNVERWEQKQMKRARECYKHGSPKKCPYPMLCPYHYLCGIYMSFKSHYRYYWRK